MIVERYSYNADSTGYFDDPFMRQNPNGRFVLHDDYNALLTHHNALVEAVKEYLDCSDKYGGFEGVDGEVRRNAMKVWVELRAEVDRLIAADDCKGEG